MVNFFSPLDIFFVFPRQFPDAIHPDERTETVTISLSQHSILHGNLNQDDFFIKFEDCSAILGHSSLLNKLKTLGFRIDKKQQADKWKQRMDRFLKRYPDKFFDYAEWDVKILPDIYKRTQEKINKLTYDLQIKKITAPLTLGSTVAKILHEHLIKSQKGISKRAELNELMTNNSQKGFLKKYKWFKEFAFITGGRCNNEQPDKYVIENACDLDIVGCYTNIMKKLEIPLAKITALDNKETQYRIRDFFENTDLYKDYWSISFNAYFSFDQDIFPTKILSKSSEEKYDEETLLTTLYLQRQVKNGILTHSILEIIFKYWSDSQIEEFLNIKFNKAIYHLKNTVIQTYKLNDIIDYFQILRQNKKNPLNQIAKIFVNTLYGVMVSDHFLIGNVLLGNIITATARSQVYMKKQECNLNQTITDGGICEFTSDLEEKIKKLPFEVSFKMRNQKAVYFGKADYTYGELVKTRGTKNPNNIKQIFLKSLLDNQPFNLLTRFSYDIKIKKINAYNQQIKSKDISFISTRHIPAGAEFYQPKIFHISASHTKFKDIEEYKEYKLIEERRKRNHQGLYEQFLLTQSFKEIFHRVTTRNLEKIDLNKPDKLNTQTINLCKVEDKHRDIHRETKNTDIFVFKKYYRTKKINLQDAQAKIINIYFKGLRALQSERIIYDKITEEIFKLQDHTNIQIINLYFERYQFTKTKHNNIYETKDFFISYAISTINQIHYFRWIKYAIFFLESRSDTLFEYKNYAFQKTILSSRKKKLSPDTETQKECR